ncbi:hypothetical protein OVA24_00060 [Luteolibacter sp. SL250]|uniref:hypothetical protein n=1 Tax=Luteolibacter sp. SL250 TaxID=2995170 RepID=UPI00226F26A3|nr:hypothetical protein [Luteolibacter sp. SL250]WAC19770.1 hypothetical protein OVA24_00060 [Luteolibacter sp. SL250]
MAWRIDEAVTRGEIDNTVEGRTTGRIWLAGRDSPLVLSLDGDCWRDLAGTRLLFENPEPKQGNDGDSLDLNQSGVIGDMTASRKSKVRIGGEDGALYDDDGKDAACEWRNVLYLEWFSEINGRVVLESWNYHLTIFPHEWQMDEDAEEAQKLANLNAMRDFMSQVIQRRTPDDEEPEDIGELDEYAWEERLKESDRLTDAYQEVLEKYMEDADSERKEAFVMGWDGLLDALAEREEAGEQEPPYGEDGRKFEERHLFQEDEQDDDGFDPLESDDEDDTHPLQARAQELALRAMDLVRRDEGPGTPSYKLISSLLQVSGKLAGALNGRGSGYEPETGFVLAVLKRCLNWLNDAVGACQELIALEKDPDHRAALEHLRSSAFEIRDSVVELRRELK